MPEKNRSKIIQINDIQELSIDKNLPKETRLKQYVNKIKNPYYFKYKNVEIKVEFVENKRSIDEILINYFCELQ